MTKILSLFTGIGAFEKALANIGQSFEVVNYCEIDKFASCAYSAIHGISEELNLWDVTKIDTRALKDFDLLTHGSPCQSFSLAGKGEGGDEGSGTKSSLMWYTVDIIRNKLPKYVVWENVKSVLSKKHKHNFDKYIKTLEELGYNNYYKVLNSKDFGVPQSRERLFVISIRKDVDSGNFKFPEGTNNNVKLADILESNVDRKYYIENQYISDLIKEFEQRIRGDRRKNKYGLLRLGEIKNPKMLKMNKRVFSKDGVCPTLLAASGGGNMPKIYVSAIRQPTPLECWRIQGFNDDDYWKARTALEEIFYKGKDRSDSQMYKMAGNSIPVPVLEHIFKNLL